MSDTAIKSFSALVSSDRKFEVGNEVFEWVTPYWEDLATLYDDDVALTQAALRALAREDEEEAPDVPTTKDNVERTQKRIALFLDESDHERWYALCARRTDPVPMHMYGQVFTWLMETATGRPTPPPSDSAPGGGNGEASSPAASRSRAGVRKG